MIEFQGVSKRYGANTVIDDLTLTLPTGKISALIGPSGSGKSTSLRMINRLTGHDAGRLLVGGVDVTTLPAVALRRRIGYVIQSIGLFPHWSVARNIGTVPTLLGWSSDDIAKRTDALLDLVGLAPAGFRDRYPHQLSGGQQQRVGVARALAADPDILLMDEPFGALDPVTREDLQNELLRIQQATAKTIVFVTHDIDEAIKLGDQVVVLREGRLVQAGPPADLLRSPADGFIHDFVGGPLLGLRLLRTTTVGDHLRPIEAAAAPSDLRPETRLDAALAAMVAGRAETLAVVDRGGRSIGSVRLRDLVAT